jgi:MoxR-like ATPase
MTDAAAIHDRFHDRGFIVDEVFATALQILLALEKPLLVECPAGVGKTESAKVLAAVLGTDLIRLQCYEGLDAMAALYEWNYPRQMLHARLSEAEGSSLEEREAYMFSERFLLKRPLLDAITRERSPVLLIDEVDRADEAFEAFLLEVLAEWQVTIPELGTIRARHKPHVILTSNRTRELSDALRRRCLFIWLPYPSLQQEIEILHARVPGLSDRLAQQIARLMQVLRGLSLQKAPGVAESLDWALALISLHRDHLEDLGLRGTHVGMVNYG